MFTKQDIQLRTIFVINCIKERDLRVSNGELLLEEREEKRTLTKLPFQKILALFVVGHIRITTPLIEKCKKFNVALVVVKPSLRPVFYWSHAAEANYLLRQKQHCFNKEDLSIARFLVMNKVQNQLSLLTKSRKTDEQTRIAKQLCRDTIQQIAICNDYQSLLGLEGQVSKMFFTAYFQDMDWQRRAPRTKLDALNATLDIGYTILFNYIECFVRMFGFDIYVGVYHRLWFKRKSLICDLMEPFRCIIDRTIRNAYHRKQFSTNDFTLWKGEYRLKIEKNGEYYKVFFDALIPYKKDIFCYVQNYYRYFMQRKSVNQFPNFQM